MIGQPLIVVLSIGRSGSRFHANNPPFSIRPKRMGHPDLWLEASFFCRGWCGFDGVVFAGKVGRGLDVGCGWVDGLCNFDAEDVAGAEHVAGEEDQSPHTENIEIYTNAEEVELLLNGKSLGTQKLHADASPITFVVPFEPGTLKAVARINGKVVAQDELRTAGKPARLILTTGLTAAELTNPPAAEAAPTLTSNWNNVTYVTVTLVDANNTVIPDSETRIHFAATGPGTIVAVDNGNLLDHDPFEATDRKLYEGHAIAILRATAQSGSITFTATAEGLPQATMTLHVARSRPDPDERSF